MTAGDARLDIGFIGGGSNSAIGNAHFTACMLDDRFRVVGGCFSRHQAVNLDTARRWHIDSERCDTDWLRWLDTHRGMLDAVAILTPIPDHHAMIRAALERGIPVIAEKAVTATREEAEDIQHLCNARPHFLAVTLNYSGYPAIRRLRQLLRDGALGRLQQIHLEMPLENFQRIPHHSRTAPRPQAWRQSDGRIPTLLLDLGTHLAHLAQFVTDASPVAVMADFQSHSTLGLIDDARLWVDYEQDIKASFWMSKCALGHRNGMRLRLFGDAGAAEWIQATPESLQLTDRHGVRRILERGMDDPLLDAQRYNRFKAGHPAGYLEGFANLYADIADALDDYHRQGSWHNDFVTGIDHSLEGLALLDAAVTSNTHRSWQRLDALASPRLAEAA